MIDDFLVRALVGGVGVALASGPLGSFIVWKRMAYFGDALAHSALLGIALGILLDINLTVGIVGLSVLFSLVLVYLRKQRTYSNDTLLGIMAHSALAIGLVVLSLMQIRIDLMGYLFGDILAISMQDIGIIYTSTAVILGMVAFLWRDILFTTIHPDLARVEGVNVDLTRLYLMLLISLFVALSIKIVGILLVTSLLIIPAATARRFSRTPEQMILLASVVGCFSVVGGLVGSLKLDTPSGPSIVVVATLLFIISNLIAVVKCR